jgi:predicted CxxxxCH...CXXCH cytochrome family protein
MSIHRFALWATLSAALLAGCSAANPTSQEASASAAGTCDRCHGFPPNVPSQGGARAIEDPNHPNNPNCFACHARTVDANGALIPGGDHMNGRVDVTAHADNYADPSVHGRDAVANLASCKSCHGESYDGAAGPSCNACHATASAKFPNGVASWQSNCTFCHGTATEPYPSIANPVLAAPPEGVAGQTAATDPHVGAHQKHLQGGALAQGFACATCHAVPSDLTHVVNGPVPVVPQGAGQASLPADLGTYTAADQTCAVYCHGSTLAGASGKSPAWTAATTNDLGCTACHGAPPPSGRVVTTGGFTGTLHEVHVIDGGVLCAYCHADTAGGTLQQPTIANKSFHVNGVKDVKFSIGSGNSWDAASGNCTVMCHLGTRSWR